MVSSWKGEPGGRRGRIQRAADTLAVSVDEVPAAVSAFIGVPAPGTDDALRLVRHCFAIIDKAPLHTFMIGDLGHDAASWPMVPVTVPAMPWQAPALVDGFSALLHELPSARLYEVATGVAVRRSDVGRALREANVDAGAESADDEVWGPGDGGPNRLQQRINRESQLIADLMTAPPAAWSVVQRRGVHKAVLQHLAELADGLLRVSEADPARLVWLSIDGRLGGCRFVPGAPAALEAQLSPLAVRPQPEAIAELNRPVWPVVEVPGWAGWEWQVGWRLPSGRFVSQQSSREATRAAAVFAAEQTMAALAGISHTVRQRFTGRLLMPRTRLSVDEATRVVTLGGLLYAVSGQMQAGRGEAAGQLWPSLPHTAADGRLGSMVAALFDQIGVPFPDAGEFCNTLEAGHCGFADFLASHAIVLTPFASAYLQGTNEPAPGPQSLQTRHAAGIRAALALADAADTDRLIADIGPLPDGMAWTDLLSLQAVDSFLTAATTP